MGRINFLVVSYAIPNRASGTPVVIRKFLENFKHDEVVLIGRPVLKREKVENLQFNYPTLTIPTPPVGFRGERLWRLISVFFGLFTGWFAIAKYRPNAILAFYRDESSLLTGYLLHKLSGLPLYSYFCDLYLENYPGGFYGKLAAWLQPRVFTESKCVLVLTEAMQEYYRQTYQVDALVLPHCNNDPVTKIPYPGEVHTPFRIAYLGSVNIDRIFSLRELCIAIDGRKEYFLSYFSATSPDYLDQQGLAIQNSEIKFIPGTQQLLNELAACDLLFLPVMSSSESQRELQMITGFPTKAIEYLLVQKPILVHSKPSYFVFNFFKKFKCGCTTSGNFEELLRVLEQVKSDSSLRKELVSNTIPALEYFRGEIIAEAFLKLIDHV